MLGAAWGSLEEGHLPETEEWRVGSWKGQMCLEGGRGQDKTEKGTEGLIHIIDSMKKTTPQALSGKVGAKFWNTSHWLPVSSEVPSK
jgi:hypothetical protein